LDIKVEGGDTGIVRRHVIALEVANLYLYLEVADNLQDLSGLRIASISAVELNHTQQRCSKFALRIHKVRNDTKQRIRVRQTPYIE
jgi:hypothetical protein